MQIAILSDIHDHIWTLREALRKIASQAEMLICCGDLCAPFIMRELIQGFPHKIHVVFGNNDADLFRITSIAEKEGERVKLHGELGRIQCDGRAIAMNHYDNIATDLAASGNYDLVCFGHNHRWEITEIPNPKRNVPTLKVNPGTLMGTAFQGNMAVKVDPSYLMYNSSTHTAELIIV